MIILGLRTDSAVTHLYLAVGDKVIAELEVETGRELATKLPSLVRDFTSSNNYDLHDIGGIVCYAGPGSFTGLRIGHTYANTIAYTSDIPIVQKTGENWLLDGSASLMSGENTKIIIPEYGHEPNITKPTCK